MCVQRFRAGLVSDITEGRAEVSKAVSGVTHFGRPGRVSQFSKAMSYRPPFYLDHSAPVTGHRMASNTAPRYTVGDLVKLLAPSAKSTPPCFATHPVLGDEPASVQQEETNRTAPVRLLRTKSSRRPE